MKKLITRTGLALALGATAIVASAPAQAQRYNGRGSYHGRDNGAGTAIVAGIAGLAIGAAIASSSRRSDRDVYARDSYQEYPQAYYQDGYDRNDYRSYDRDSYRAYDRGYARDCTVRRAWDRYSGREVRVRVCN